VHYVTVDGQKYTQEEYEELRKREEEKQRSEQEEVSRLVREAGEAFRRAQEFIQSRPELVRQVGDADAVEHELFEKLRKNLDKADEAPRCEKVREDGTMCGCPRMNGHNYCYAHERMLQARARKLELPPLEDGNGIQMALMLVQRALIDDEISVKKAGLLLYSLQTAALNLKNTTFCEAEDDELVTEMPSEETEGEKVVRGRKVWSSEYDNLTTETTTPASEALAGDPGRRHGEEVSRRSTQMSADGKKDTAEGGCATRGSKGPSASQGVEQEQKPDAAEGTSTPASETLAGDPGRRRGEDEASLTTETRRNGEERTGMARVSRLDLGMTGEG